MVIWTGGGAAILLAKLMSAMPVESEQAGSNVENSGVRGVYMRRHVDTSYMHRHVEEFQEETGRTPCC